MLISTGKDCKVTIHSANKGTFEFIKTISLDVHFHCSSIDYMDGKVLLGHDNGVISTLSLEDDKETVHNTSHHDGECWGLEVIPENHTFLTSGDDNQFFEVSIKDRKVLRGGKIWTSEYNDGKAYETNKIRSTASSLCGYPAHQQSRAICYSALHKHVAVANNQGDILVFSYHDFTQVVASFKAPKEWVECMKYSPDSRFLAIGAHDDTIYIYKISAEGKYSLHYKIEYMHSSAVTAMDWSKDSRYLKAIDQAYSKMYYDITECVHIKDGCNVLTDPAIWQTSTCKLGWEMMGVYPLGADGTDVNSVDVNADHSLIAVADDFGTMCLYRFPCLKVTHDCARVAGHSEHVSRVKFYEDQADPAATRVITAGGNDRAYIQWRPVERQPEEDE